MTEIIVTKIRRAEHGELEARISTNGTTVAVSRRFGSWQIIGRDGSIRDVLPRFAAELQKRARPFERREANQEEER